MIYYDGQFDDARLLINLAQTAAEQGATLLNYARVTGLTRDGEGFVDGVDALDVEIGRAASTPGRRSSSTPRARSATPCASWPTRPRRR